MVENVKKVVDIIGVKEEKVVNGKWLNEMILVMFFVLFILVELDLFVSKLWI